MVSFAAPIPAPMRIDQTAQLWSDVESLVLRHTPSAHHELARKVVRQTADLVTLHFVSALNNPSRFDELQQEAIEAFADLGAALIQTVRPESHDELTLELTRLIEKLHGAYLGPPPGARIH